MLLALLIIYMFLSQFDVETLFGKLLFVGGFPLLTWILYLMYIIMIGMSVLVIMTTGKHNRYKAIFALYIAIMLIEIVYSLISGVPVQKVVSTSLGYMFSITFAAYIMFIDVDKKLYYKLICWIVILGGIVSILFWMGTLKEIATEDISGLSRSSLIVDGGLGLVGIAVAMHMLIYKTDAVSNKIKYLTLVMGAVIIVAGESRARIMTMMLVVLLSALFSILFSGKQRSRVLMILVIIGVIAAAAFTIFPDFTDAVFGSISGRFETMGTDNASVFRVLERERQMEEFRKNVFMGSGWGGMYDVVIKNLWGDYCNVDNHNMYTSILAYGGLLYAIPYFLWFILLFIKEFKNMKQIPDARLNLVLLVAAFVLAWSSAGFLKHSQLLSMIIVYANIVHREGLLLDKKIKREGV